ncbi:MAG TPA: hypothetical protein VGG74_14765 [Kofleriaceae bacterium]|jgi:hypothetical protein
MALTTSSTPSTRALPASDVFARFLKIADDDFYKPDCTITVQTGSGLTWSNLRLVQGKPQGAQARWLDEIARVFAERPSIGITTCSIQRAHQNQQNQTQLQYSCNDGLVATFVVNHAVDNATALLVLDLAATHFDLSPVSQIVVNNDGPWHEAVLKSREATISELSAALQKLIGAAAQFTTQDAERRRVADEELERRYREREAQLRMEFDAKLAVLDKRAASLAEKEKEYLTRNAQLARRGEQHRLEELLKDVGTVTVSASVAEKRKSTFKAIITLVVVAAIVAVVAGVNLFLGYTFEWKFAVPFASSMFVVFATLTYFIQWNDRWARDHADAEFLSRRYRVDALRAQWLAEWVSESTEGGKNLPLPPELVAAFSRNMFEAQTGGGEPLRHALERLVDQAKRIEVGGGRTVVETGSEKK